MINTIKRRQASEAGFTLVELLIVIVIMGILAAVVVFSVGGISDRGSSSACRSTVRAVDTAAEAYYAKNGTAAATIGALVAGDFLQEDENFTDTSGTSVTVSGKTITYSPTDGAAGNASATC